MKKIIIITQFLFFNTIAFAQADTLFSSSPLDFYPLNDGDIRHYLEVYRDPYLVEYTYFYEKVLNDTVIDGMNFKKKLIKKILITSRGDTVSGVYYKNERIDTLTFKVYDEYDNTVICLATQPGDFCLSTQPGDFYLNKECSILYQNLFGRLREVKSFYKRYVYNDVSSFDNIEIAANVGITYVHHQPGNRLTRTSLKYASINGIEYGTPLPIFEVTYKEDLTSNKSHPTNYILHQNYPNPFNLSTSIKFILAKSSYVKIELYNIAGQKVQTLLNKKMQAGTHRLEYNAQNLSSGIYFYSIEAGDFQDVKKMILLQ